MVNKCITALVAYGIEKKLITPQDANYVANRIIGLIGAKSYAFEAAEPGEFQNIEEILDPLLDFANPEVRDNLSCQIMDTITPMPSQVIERFQSLQPKEATDFFYQFSQDTNYIMTQRVKKDIKWEADNGLIITINLSKPEKDPKEIEKAKLLAQSGYPKCMLCVENEGYIAGARGNHRIVPIKLCGEDWYFQYSPYVYYKEHSIVFNKEHIPMAIHRNCFEKLLAFTEQFPHYMVGSNADLPIVGGSILAHEHFQAGNFDFPMAHAKVWETVDLEGVCCELLEWPLSCIRLKSKDQKKICDIGEVILAKWKGYDDLENDIIAVTDQPHNTITPIARWRDGFFELDLVLRNNRTSPEFPSGIFNAHPEYHHIKKENIGLIEVMGLAILPPRLAKELDVQDEAVRKEISDIFMKILENCGVFKDTEIGRKGFIRFMQSVKDAIEG